MSVRYLSGVESQPIIRGEASLLGGNSMCTSTRVVCRKLSTASAVAWATSWEALQAPWGPWGDGFKVIALKWRLRESKELASGVLAALGRWEAWSQMQW